jgi:hypothetical protein
MFQNLTAVMAPSRVIHRHATSRNNRYLVSLWPAEELAQFLANRGHCLLDNGHAKEAFDAYAMAKDFAPKEPAYPSWMGQVEAQLRLPTYRPAESLPPRGAPNIYKNDPLAEMERINAANRAHMLQRQPGMPHAARPGMPNPYQPYRPPVPGTAEMKTTLPIR